MVSPESERATRARRIDPKLTTAGWPVTPGEGVDSTRSTSPLALTEFETSNGPADYALCHKGQVRGVVEAKKLTLGPQGVLVQAERYARGIRQVPMYQGQFGVPFLYSTNGEQLWFHDVRNQLNRSRQVATFHTPAAFDELLTRDFEAELAAPTTVPQNDRLRPYQV